MDWKKLEENDRPILLYGTGNAADRIIAELNSRGIRLSGIFASDGFVRERVFAGFRVMSYSQAKYIFGEMTVLLCFGTHIPEVMEAIRKIADEQNLFAPDLPVAGDGLFTEQFFREHETEIRYVRSLLADSVSRNVLDSVIRYKLTGCIDYLAECETDEKSNWELLGLSENDRYLDLGAYTGDTVKRFLECTGGSHSGIVAVEPDSRNFRKLSSCMHKDDNVICLNKAAGRASGTVFFDRNAGRGGTVRESGVETEVIAVDDIDMQRGFSFIKMDLEGMETDAIDGAVKTITKFRPSMLISAYHRRDDLWNIPLKVLEICPGYRVFLRKDPCIPAWEVNYYFVR